MLLLIQSNFFISSKFFSVLDSFRASYLATSELVSELDRQFWSKFFVVLDGFEQVLRASFSAMVV